MMDELARELSKTGTPLTCPVAIVVRDGKVLMGLRHYTPDKWKQVSVWTVPGGRCDPGETLETTLRREVAEETAITELEIVSYLGTVPGAKDGDVVPLFECRTSQEAQLVEPEKFSEWRWFGADEVPDNFINPAALVRIKELLSKS